MPAPGRDLVAPVANMLMAAIAGGGWGREPSECDHGATSRTSGADLSPPVDADAGAGTPRIDGPTICDGRRGDPPRVDPVRRRHDRCRLGTLGARWIAAARVCRAGQARLSRRGGRDLWPRDLTLCS